MDRKTFFKQLDQRIIFSDDEERELCIRYYDELIDEYINAGISEEEAISGLNIDEIVEQYDINLNVRSPKSKYEIEHYFKKTDLNFAKKITIISALTIVTFTIIFFLIVYLKQGNLNVKETYGLDLFLRIVIMGFTWMFLFGYYVFFIWRYIKRSRLYNKVITISYIFLMISIYITFVVLFILLLFYFYLKLRYSVIIILSLLVTLTPYFVLLIMNVKNKETHK